MAKESTVGYLPGNDPAAMQANLDYQNALMRMEEALNARQSRFLDPQMLALAQGFLAPTQTGSFGESLGIAAKNVREAQQQEEKEERDIAQARLGLAGRGIELERLKQRDREFSRLMGGEPTPSGAPAGPLSTTSETKPGPLTGIKPPPGFEGVTGIPVSPPNPNFMTGRQYLGMARLDPSIAPTTAIKDAQDLEKKRYEVREGGVQDLASGMFYAFPKGELVERQIFGQEGTFKVDARTAALLDMYSANGDPRYYEIAERVVKGPKAPPKPGERPKIGGPEVEEPEGKEGKPGRISSVQETEAKTAGMREEAQLTAKEQSEESKKWYARGDDASSVMNDYRILRGIFAPSNPSAKLMSGVFEKGDVASQVGTLLESGLTGDSLKTAARKIATNAGLNETQIAQFQVAVGAMASIKLKASRIMEGQGTITEAERLLIAESAIGITDTPKTVLAKTELFMARAKFEERRARALREFRDSGKGNYNQFVLSPQYARMKDEYENEVERVVERRLGIKIPKNQQGSRDNASAASRLPEDVR